MSAYGVDLREQAAARDPATPVFLDGGIGKVGAPPLGERLVARLRAGGDHDPPALLMSGGQSPPALPARTAFLGKAFGVPGAPATAEPGRRR